MTPRLVLLAALLLGLFRSGAAVRVRSASARKAEAQAAGGAAAAAGQVALVEHAALHFQQASATATEEEPLFLAGVAAVGGLALAGAGVGGYAAYSYINSEVDHGGPDGHPEGAAGKLGSAGGPVRTAQGLNVVPTDAKVGTSNPLKPIFGFHDKLFQREHVARNMARVDCQGNSEKAGGIPLDFSGLWWMDGNFMPERVASFGQARWIDGEKGCKEAKLFNYGESEKSKGIIKSWRGDTVPCKGRLEFGYWDDRTWAFAGNVAGKAAADGMAQGSINVELVCGGRDDDPYNLTICKTQMPVQWAATRKALKLVSDYVFTLDYQQQRVNNDMWVRYTPFPLKLFAHQYFLKRIIDCNGDPVQPYFDQFNSGGKAVDDFGGGGMFSAWGKKKKVVKDVFGGELNSRSSVATVGSKLMVRVKGGIIR